MADLCETAGGEDICRSPFDYFYWLPHDVNPTQGHRNCWVGMGTSDRTGFATGEGCALGCRSCPDLPTELVLSNAPTDGTRWLAPHPEAVAVDAEGMRRPLIAGTLHLIPRLGANYLRGHCFDNFGVECFGGNVCECVSDRSGLTNIGETGNPDACIPSPRGNRELAAGYFADQFAYQGVDFPPFGTGLWCRRFETQGLDQDYHVTLAEGELHSPAFIRNNVRVPLGDNHCTVNAMVPCVGAVPNSECTESFYHVNDASIPPMPPPVWYNGGSSRVRFGTINLIGDPHFRSTDNLFDGLSDRDLAHLAMKNAAIATARTTAFPTGDGTIRFDQVDHEFRYRPGENGKLNNWARQWDAEDLELDAESLPVLVEFPIKVRFVNSGKEVQADLVITRVESYLWLLPMQVKDRSRWPTEVQIEPHARYHLAVEVRVRFEAGRRQFKLPHPWLPGHELREVPGYTVDFGNRISEPVIRPPIDRYMILDAEGRPFDPLSRVVWEGYLGQASKPASPKLDVWQTDINGMCTSMHDAMAGLEMPGAPFGLDTAPKDPAQIHGGKLTLEFAA